METQDLERRVHRLERLCAGLCLEVEIWKEDTLLDPLERRGYLRCLQNAIAGMDHAQVVLNDVLKRLARERRA